MKFAIITHVQHIKKDNQYFGYAPYIREMNIGLKYVDEVIIVAPLVDNELNPIHEMYIHSNISFRKVAEFEITSVANVFKTILKLPKIFSSVYKGMSQADHIHLRCPGNMGLVGAVVQIFFPKKTKTAKYAGNWDPKAKQPWTYKLQKWILSNTFLTKNMQVLVYGEWENQTKNIRPFFTATYSEEEIQNSEFRIQNSEIEDKVKFLFVGTLSPGKQPLYAMQLVAKLHKLGIKVSLDFYGEGVLRNELATYIKTNNLAGLITLKGNQTKEVIKEAYQTNHFLILPSKSEGWPKVVAEAMFWGCVPVATAVSCVPYMVNYGKRGILLEEDVKKDAQQLIEILKQKETYQIMAKQAIKWSREYTLEKFETEIKKLLL